MAASNVRQKALVIVLVCLLNLNNASVVDDTDVVQWPPDLETRCYPNSSHLQQVTGKLEHLLSRIVAGGGFDFQNQPLNPPNNCSGSKWGNVVSELLEFENSLRSLKQPIWEVEASEFKSAVSQRLTRLRNALNNFSSGAYHENGDFTKIQNLLMSIPRMTVDICINLIQRNQSEKALEMYGTDDKIGLSDIVKIRHYNNLDAVSQFCADMGKDSVSCFQNLTEQVVESNRLFTDRTIWKLLSILRAVISDSSGDVGPLEESLKRLKLEAVRHYSRQIQKFYEVADEVKKYCPELMQEIIVAAYGNNLDNTEAVTFFCKAIGDEERKNCMVYLSGKVLSVGGWYKNPNILKFKEFISNATDSNEIREINMKLEAALVKHYGVLVRRQGHRVNRKLFRMFDPQLKQGIVRFAYDRNPSHLDPVISFIEYLNGKELVVCYETLFNIMKESGHLKVARLAMKIKFGYLPSKLKKVRDPLTENRRRNLEAQLKSLEVVISVVNGGPFGDWGKKDFCLKGSRATGFMIKNEKPIARGDDTALNGIRLYCHYPDGSFANWISSTEGNWGTWTERKFCPPWTHLKSFRLNVEDKPTSDKTSVNEINLNCSNEMELRSGGNGWGTWGLRSDSCLTGICGIQTKVDPEHGKGYDDTALNDVKFICC